MTIQISVKIIANGVAYRNVILPALSIERDTLSPSTNATLKFLDVDMEKSISVNVSELRAALNAVSVEV